MSVARTDLLPGELTLITVRGQTVERLRQHKQLNALEDYDAVIRDLFRRSEDVLVRARFEASPSKSRAVESPRRTCGRTTTYRGKLVACRRDRGHDDDCAWWNRGGSGKRRLYHTWR
jgi:hypothetical protein